jgi:hypothetical protein
LIGSIILNNKLDIITILNDFLNLQKIKFLILSKEQMACVQTLPKSCLVEQSENDKNIINCLNNRIYENLEEEKFKSLEQKNH